MFGAVEIDQQLRALNALAKGSTWRLTTIFSLNVFLFF